VQSPVTRTLVLVCVALQGLALLFPALGQLMQINLALIPARVTAGLALPPALDWGLPPLATVATHALLHGGVAHLVMNMLFLWVVGGAVEAVVGSGRFAWLYAAGAIAGGIAELIASPLGTNPVVGASGAISAALAAYALMFSRDREEPTRVAGIAVSANAVRAIRYASLWIGLQLLVEPPSTKVAAVRWGSARSPSGRTSAGSSPALP
jgi:membrane associated rhomboid family serine protease